MPVVGGSAIFRRSGSTASRSAWSPRSRRGGRSCRPWLASTTTIHAPVRLRISGILRHIDQIDFAVLRDTLGVTDATLSKHMKVLVEAAYATTTKSRSATRSDARRLTWIAQTLCGPGRVRRARGGTAAHRRRVRGRCDCGRLPRRVIATPPRPAQRPPGSAITQIRTLGSAGKPTTRPRSPPGGPRV